MKKYFVRSEYNYDDVRFNYTNYPMVAIKKWFEEDCKNPMATDLVADCKENAIELIKWAYHNNDFILAMNNKYPCHIKMEYLLQWLEEEQKGNCQGFLGCGDSVFPFCAG